MHKSKSAADKKYLDWWATENKKRQDKEINFKGLRLWVKKNVFCPDPHLTHSSAFIARFLTRIKGKTVLDMGTGCGALAILASRRGARSVCAVDIDQNALENAKLNVKRYRLDKKIKIIDSNLFDNLTEKYDVIMANLPIAFSSPVWKGMKTQFVDLIPRWVRQVKEHLTPTGKAYLAWASFGDRKVISRTLQSVDVKWHMWQESAFGVTWQVYVFERGTDSAWEEKVHVS